VLIADDHAPTRAGVRMTLERDGLEICAEVANAADAVDAALRERPDVCLLDVRMPGRGTSAAASITSTLPNTVVLMLTVSRDDDDLFESLRQGAVGYLLKDMNPADLPAAVRGAFEGEGALPGSLVARLIEEFRHGRAARRVSWQPRGGPQLTNRETEILELLCEGAGTGEIAERLFVSRVTVRRHVSNILGKLGASSREEATRLALAEVDGNRRRRPRLSRA
jgi:two-component system, NarL family, nitrate/nitrite response regulator NarL